MIFNCRALARETNALLMFGPFISAKGAAHKQARLIAFIDDASRVLCHGEFFLEENIDSMFKANQFTNLEAYLRQSRCDLLTARM